MLGTLTSGVLASGVEILGIVDSKGLLLSLTVDDSFKEELSSILEDSFSLLETEGSSPQATNDKQTASNKVLFLIFIRITKSIISNTRYKCK